MGVKLCLMLYSSRSWHLEIDPSVYKTLKKIPQGYAKNILHVIKLLPFDPYFGDIQKMKNIENVWRRRIGAYRLFYKMMENQKVILVFHLERRTSKTYH